MPISAATASVAPGLRDTLRIALSVLPVRIVRVVAPPLIFPSVRLIGRIISKGAPAGTTALNCPAATFCSDTVRGIGLTALPDRLSFVNDDSPENRPSGRFVSWPPLNLSDVKLVNLLKIPSGRLVNWRLLTASDVRFISRSNTFAGSLFNCGAAISKFVRSVSGSNTPARSEVNPLAPQPKVSKFVRPSNTPVGSLFKFSLSHSIYVTLLRSVKSPAGSEVNFPVVNPNAVSPVSPSKSPAFTALLSITLRLVIAARCASVTSAALSTPGTASTIASRTSGVRLLTGVNSPLGSVDTIGKSPDLTRA